MKDPLTKHFSASILFACEKQKTERTEEEQSEISLSTATFDLTIVVGCGLTNTIQKDFIKIGFPKYRY